MYTTYTKYQVRTVRTRRHGPDRAGAGSADHALGLSLPRLPRPRLEHFWSLAPAPADDARGAAGRLALRRHGPGHAGREIVRALKGVAEDVKFRDVVVVATAPELLIAAGVSVASLRVLTLLLPVLVQVLLEPEGK